MDFTNYHDFVEIFNLRGQKLVHIYILRNISITKYVNFSPIMKLLIWNGPKKTTVPKQLLKKHESF